MKKKIVLILAVLFAAWSGIQAKTALLIVAHGSPMESWRKPVLDLEPMVKQQLANGKLKGIDLVKVALMEYTEPSVASMVKACEAEGADSIFALPIYGFCKCLRQQRYAATQTLKQAYFATKS